MKRNIFIIGILSLLFSFACTKERINTPKKDKIDASLKVGNILLRDGSIIDVKHYDTINKQGVGIIFYVNKKYSQANEIKALAVSLENLMPVSFLLAINIMCEHRCLKNAFIISRKMYPVGSCHPQAKLLP